MRHVSSHVRHNIVGYIALFVALGGTSYAATTSLLPRNSVGTAQLRNEAVTRTKIAKKTLAALKGNVGAQGPKGDAGVKGDPGATGATGAPNPNAIDSDKVNGLHANELVRGSMVTSGIPILDFKTGTYTPLLTKSVTAPVNGILLAWGNVEVLESADALFDTKLFLDDAPMSVKQTAAYLGEGWSSLSPSGAIPVTAGQHTVTLRGETTQAGFRNIYERSITTLFVPFGDGGTQGLPVSFPGLGIPTQPAMRQGTP